MLLALRACVLVLEDCGELPRRPRSELDGTTSLRQLVNALRDLSGESGVEFDVFDDDDDGEAVH